VTCALINQLKAELDVTVRENLSVQGQPSSVMELFKAELTPEEEYEQKHPVGLFTVIHIKQDEKGFTLYLRRKTDGKVRMWGPMIKPYVSVGEEVLIARRFNEQLLHEHPRPRYDTKLAISARPIKARQFLLDSKY
jgi:hypothetical protein